MSKTNAIRVLIADDHLIIREGLASILEVELDMTVVGRVCNGHEAVEHFRQHRPDVTLMDLRMPDMDGVTAITAIRAEYPAAHIIVLTTYDGDEDIYRGLRAGARSYLLKDTPREELLAAIRAVYAGRTYISSDIGGRFVERASSPGVTDRETEVLRLVAAGKSNQEIAAALYIAESTVKTHINHILNKLGASDRAQALAIALKQGIVQLP